MKLARNQRGAAAVETAISMIFIVPIFMYSLFMDDLLRYRLDLQEAVLSTPWDFTTQNFNPEAQGNKTDYLVAVQHHARLMYCDHESGIDSFNGESDSPDCSGETHHTSMISHVCWLNGNAKQITCGKPQIEVGASGNKLYGSYQETHDPNGGLVVCSGKEIVENYLLPRVFLPEFSQYTGSSGQDGELSKENWGKSGQSVHTNSIDGGSTNAYYLEEERFGVVSDSWAVNKDQEADPDKTGSAPEFHARMKTVYTSNNFSKVFEPAADAYITAVKVELLSPGVPGQTEVTEPRLSVTTTPEFKHPINQEGKSENYFNVPWLDRESDEYKRTYQERKNHYLGCKDAESC